MWHVPLYFQVMSSTPSLAVRFLLSTVGFSTLLTILFLHARRSVLLCMLLHQTINYWRMPALGRVFQDIHINTDGPAGWLFTGLMAVVTVSLIAYLGPQLKRVEAAGSGGHLHAGA